MKFLLILSFVFASLYVAAQNPPPVMPADSDYDKVFTSVQLPAEFPGGAQAWTQFLVDHIKHNTPTKNKAPVGNYKVVYTMLIDTTGEVKEVTILENPGYGTGEDVLRVMQKCPRWMPALLNGRKVIYRQKQVITYQVTGN